LAHRAAFQSEGNQEQGRDMTAVAALFPPPTQKAEGEVEGVAAVFLDGEAGRPVDGGEAAGQGVLVMRGDERILLKALPGPGVGGFIEHDELRTTLLTGGPQLAGLDLKSPPSHQGVLELREAVRQEGQGLLRTSKIQQAI